MDTWTPRSARPLPPYDRLEQELSVLLQSAVAQDRWSSYIEVKRRLRKGVGEWADGWCWGEIDGGPVRRWCCYDHSFLQGKTGEEPALTVGLVLSGLRDWDKVLDECEALFAGLEIKEPIDVDIAVLEVVNFIIDLTMASDAWYNFCTLVLSWYLQSLGFPEGRARKAVRKAVAGHFQSWSGPSEKAKEQIAETFREIVWRKVSDGS